jgi:hypothetical protein
MKTLILLTFLSVAAFVLAGYETATNTITTNTNARANTVLAASDANSMSNTNGMNHNSMMKRI